MTRARVTRKKKKEKKNLSACTAFDERDCRTVDSRAPILPPALARPASSCHPGGAGAGGEEGGGEEEERGPTELISLGSL